MSKVAKTLNLQRVVINVGYEKAQMTSLRLKPELIEKT